jgi:hypothetical protein
MIAISLPHGADLFKRMLNAANRINDAPGLRQSHGEPCRWDPTGSGHKQNGGLHHDRSFVPISGAEVLIEFKLREWEFGGSAVNESFRFCCND